MKNKLLLSSALIGSLVIAGSALAETKITGNMDISIGSRSADSAIKSSSGFGSETQINISNSGELNNGMKYAAGFSIESDTSTDAFENTYIDIMLVEGTTLSFGNDHFPGIDGTVTPKVALAADSLTGAGSGGTLGTSGEDVLYRDGTYIDTVEKQGVGIIQNLGGFGNLNAYYVPNMGVGGGSAGNDAVNFTESTNSATLISFKGNLGVEGLTVLAGQEKQKKEADEATDKKSRNIGISYNFGQFVIGASHVKTDLDDGGVKTEIKTKEAGITFAVNDNFSVGLSRHESETEGSTDEEITMVQAGYNLGAISVSLNYGQVDNLGGDSGEDEEFTVLRMGTKF